MVLREGDEEALMVAGEQFRGRYREMISWLLKRI
jgi:hypothetical protein